MGTRCFATLDYEGRNSDAARSGTNPQSGVVFPECVPVPTWIILFSLPSPSLGEERAAQTQGHRGDMVQGSIRSEATSTMASSSPNIDANINVLNAVPDDLRVFVLGCPSEVRVDPTVVSDLLLRRVVIPLYNDRSYYIVSRALRKRTQ